MSFDTLDPDCLSCIFGLTDLYTILSLSRVNRYFREIASAKQLWLSLVYDLASRGLINHPDQCWETFSAGELMAKIKRAVAGPQTWSPLSPAPPTVARQIKLTVTEPVESCPELLPGGRYVVVYIKRAESRGVELLEVQKGRRVWAWESPNCYVHEVKVAFLNATEAVLALVIRFDRLQILRVNLDTGDSQELLRLSLRGVVPSGIQISGDFILFRGHPFTLMAGIANVVVLINWRTVKTIVIGQIFNMPTLLTGAGHIILSHSPFKTFYGDDTCQLYLYSLASFNHLWKPHSESILQDLLHVPVAAPDIPYRQIINAPEADLCDSATNHVTLSIGDSALHDGTLELILQRAFAPCVFSQMGMGRHTTCAAPQDEICCTTIERYHIVLPTPAIGAKSEADHPRLPRIVLKSAISHPTRFKSTTVMGNARYGLTRDGGPDVVIHSLDEEGPNNARVLGRVGGEPLSLSSSGAILASDGGHVVVSYYI
ncbi:hypothetical protein C8R47DRAFT_1152635 [Mycena vitilis]|nr:hypothetical protein C8R47DRAFT_1152635 [Mycena vitilis]